MARENYIARPSQFKAQTSPCSSLQGGLRNRREPTSLQGQPRNPRARSAPPTNSNFAATDETRIEHRTARQPNWGVVELRPPLLRTVNVRRGEFYEPPYLRPRMKQGGVTARREPRP